MPKISELATQASPTTAAVVPIVQSSTTYKATLATLPISTATQTALDLKTTNSAAAITGGTITGITDLAVADGGTGASTAGAARTNLGSTATGDTLFTAASASAAFTAIKQDASETATGVVELATSAEYATGTDAVRALTPATARAQNIVAGTVVASTSGTSIDFTSIPSWVKKLTVLLIGVSTNGTSNLMVQVGDAGGVEASGYLGSAGYLGNAIATAATLFTTGFGVTATVASSTVTHGAISLTLQNASTNTWVAVGSVGFSDGAGVAFCGGSKSLSATLDRVRITTVNGTDAFDAGSINILYE